MEPLSWATVANLIVTLGVPATTKLIEKWSNGNPVTPAEFAEIRAIAEQSAADRMKLALVHAGIDLESEQAKALLALTK